MVTSTALARKRPADALFSCVIPAYNEAPHLARFLQELRATLDTFATRYEIIVVNDGSSDNTEQEIAPFLGQSGLRYISLSRNFGKEAALSAGIDAAKGDAVILMDADFQHPLELLPQMAQKWWEGIDMVYGVISDRSAESQLKRWGTGMFYQLMESGAPIKIPRNAGDFRLMDRSVVNALRQLPERNRFMKGLYAWVGFSSVALPFVPNRRATGVSSFSYRGLSRLALAGVTAFTTLPLRVWSAVGVAVSIFAILYAFWIAGTTLLFGNDVPGWATLAAGLMFFSGVQLISIGVLGEYLGRVYDEVKKRPLYIVAHDVDNGPHKPAAEGLPPCT
ncbi:MAG TPA: glycosyltransferase family 2 protein [Noviherbaspirillum sp.]|nr:glycosyltransferase family 2 protein [Noviherbaspirillum sp.]